MAASAYSPRHRIIVVDDNPRFPRFVYWKLVPTIELDSPADDANTDETVAPSNPCDGHRCWDSPDGRLRVIWLDSGKSRGLCEEFDDVLKKNADGLTWAVIDVRLIREANARQIATECAVAFLESAVPMLEVPAAAPDRRLFVVSSYFDQSLDVRPGGAPTTVNIRPKTPEMLDLLRTRIVSVDAEIAARDRPTGTAAPRNGAPPEDGGRDIFHILVTGAGFELRRQDTRGRARFAHGMPDTGELLSTAHTASGVTLQIPVWPDEREPRPKGPPFQVPGCMSDETLERALARAAWNRNLDLYWDLVFSNIQRRLGTDVTEDGVRYDTAQRLEAEELRYRQAFRLAIRHYDIGQLEQSVLAAKMNWAAWLTTNYTGFADRAIEFCTGWQHEMRHGATTQHPWMTIANPIEASLLQRPSVLGNKPSLRRVLIKLHGDIGQIHTMAIAGFDKQPQSPLYVRPELHVMYSAATELLLQHARSAEHERTYWWHIVGHSLWDEALVNTIVRVVQRSPKGCTHEFALVGRSPKPVLSKLRASLGDHTHAAATGFKYDAIEYLARVDRAGLPTQRAAEPTLEGWLTKLGHDPDRITSSPATEAPSGSAP